MSMNVLVLGATGATGRHVVTRALQLGHLVTTLVRDSQRLRIASDRLRVLTGNVVDDEAALVSAVSRQDAVICTLGVGKSFKSGGLIAASVPRIVRAMAIQRVRRLIFTSAFGVGDTYRDVPFVPRLFIRTLLRDVYRDKHAGEQALRNSGLDWTLIYPTGLTDGPATGAYRMGERLSLRGFPRIARADVADFLVKQLEDSSYIRKGVLVTS